jgi:hypothetical protein
MGDVAGLTSLVDAGLVDGAVGTPALAVPAAFAGLLPGGLPRTAVTAVTTGVGGMSVVLALVGAASAAGGWVAAVGMPDLGMLAGIEYGLACERLAAVPRPGGDWAAVVAALVDGFDLVLLRPAGPVPAGVARRLAARARQRRAALLVHGEWPGARLVLSTSDARWEGLGAGRGRLRRRLITVTAAGRGPASRPRTVRLALPAGGTGAAAVTEVGSPTVPLPAREAVG